MDYDEVLQELRITDSERRIVEHLFKGSFGKDVRQNEPFMIRHDDRIWFDSCSGTGISPPALVRFLRNENPSSNFESLEMWECRYHLEFLPSDLFHVAMTVYNAHRRPTPVQWEEEGF